MFRRNLIVLLLLLEGVWITHQQQLPTNSSPKSKPNDSYYVAGVVEFAPSPNRTVEAHYEGYEKIIESDEAQSADIIVFPEATFNSQLTAFYVANPKDNVTLCDNSTSSSSSNSSFLHKISCLAKKVQKYIVINISEKENCTIESQKQANDPRPCAKNGLTRYNTNVVFDRNGTIISRYRKWNLYVEEGTNKTFKPEYATFTTDFNVTFGLFTCFDILFYTPTQELVEKGVTDFVFPTMWFSELPFLTAVQNQHAWAYANDVNLLAAGASYPSVGSTGTGIYAGKKGSLVMTMSSVPERKIYTARVPKKNFNMGSTINSTTITTNSTTQQEHENNPVRLKGLTLLRDNITAYNTTFLNHTLLNTNTTVCSKSLCCKFFVQWNLLNNTITVNASSMSSNPTSSSSSSSSAAEDLNSLRSYQYALAAYEGFRTYQKQEKSYIRTCAILACTNQSISSCGTIFPDNVTVTNQLIFNQIQIEGNFNKIHKKSLIMPNNLDDSILPLKVNQFDFQITKALNGIDEIVKCHLKTPTTANSSLLTFGIYANDFVSSDGSNSASLGKSFNITTMMIMLLLSLILICVQIC